MKYEEIYLQIAGFNIKIRFLLSAENLRYENGFIRQVRSYYKNFLTEETGQKVHYVIEVEYAHSFKVILSKSSKDVFIHLYKQVNKKKVKTFYHLSGSQFQILVRKATHDLLVESKGFILHASASKIVRQAAVFLGESGAGKSTTMRILASHYTPLGDDSIIIKREGSAFYCYSSALHERNDWFFKSFEKNELGVICFIKKSKMTLASKITDKQEIIDLLGKQLFSEKEDVTKQMENLIYFVERYNKFYSLEISISRKDKLIALMKDLIDEI